MSKHALADSGIAFSNLHKSKPRYTESENELLFDYWWNPAKRKELVNQLGRKMSALRSQFCRLLKEKGISNQEYYRMMQEKYYHHSNTSIPKRNREVKELDLLIYETFRKHQALGNSRTMACAELIEKLGERYTPAALKLRFYRLAKRLQYREKGSNKETPLLWTPISMVEGVQLSPDILSSNKHDAIEENGIGTSHDLLTNPVWLLNLITEIKLRLEKLEELGREQFKDKNPSPSGITQFNSLGKWIQGIKSEYTKLSILSDRLKQIDIENSNNELIKQMDKSIQQIGSLLSFLEPSSH